MKKTIIAIIVIVLVAIGVYYLINSSKNVDVKIDQNVSTTTPVTSATSTVINKEQTVIGQSVKGNDILAYHYGTGSDEIILVGGIHGGYEWNTALLAFQTMDYLKANPSVIPANLKVTVIPVLNPDGLDKVVGSIGRFLLEDIINSKVNTVPGRFNANDVDLNRNFDCDWQASAVWQNKTVSGGSVAFSEPESLAIKNYIEANKPKAVIVFYSAAGGVFSSNCHNGVLAETKSLTNIYAKASGYKGYENFNFYETTGDMTNWLAKENIPAISILLTNHVETEWSKNKAGILAVIKYYTK